MQRVEVDRALHVIRREPREVLKHKHTAKPGRCPCDCVCSCVRACACEYARACVRVRACMCVAARCAVLHCVRNTVHCARVSHRQYRSGTLRLHRRRDWAVLAVLSAPSRTGAYSRAYSPTHLPRGSRGCARALRGTPCSTRCTRRPCAATRPSTLLLTKCAAARRASGCAAQSCRRCQAPRLRCNSGATMRQAPRKCSDATQQQRCTLPCAQHGDIAYERRALASHVARCMRTLLVPLRRTRKYPLVPVSTCKYPLVPVSTRLVPAVRTWYPLVFRFSPRISRRLMPSLRASLTTRSPRSRARLHINAPCTSVP